MQILHTDTNLAHILCQIFCHALRQCRNQYFMVICRLLIDLADQIIDLTLHRSNRNLRIKKSRRSDDLLHTHQLMLLLIHIRCSRNKKHLIDLALKFFKIERSIVQCGRQAKAIIHQSLLAGTVARVHAADLRNGNVRLVHDDQKVIREIVDQCLRHLPLRTSGKMPRIVLDPAAESRLLHHLYVKIGALRDTLRFQ